MHVHVKKIIYAGDTFTTGDAIAEAVFVFSEALARTENAETIEIPALRVDGTRVSVMLLVGPASQIVAEDAPDAPDELIDDELVKSLRQRAEAIERPTAHTLDQPERSGEEDF